jgi:hypothetical protein
MNRSWSRREVLKAVGATAAGAVPPTGALAGLVPQRIEFPPYQPSRPLDNPVTAIVAGAGNRGNVYASFSEKFPSELRIVGFAEPVPFRSDQFARRYNTLELIAGS